MIFLKILLSLFLGGTSISSYLFGAIQIVAFWKLMEKCGAEGWNALIPGWRHVIIGRLCGYEPEGVQTGIAWLITKLTYAVSALAPADSLLRMMCSAVSIAMVVYLLVCEVRLYTGLIELFQCSRKWLKVWVLFEGVVALIWGFWDKYQPAWKLDDLKQQEQTFFSGTRANVLENGLTVNLEERTARDAMQKKVLLQDIHLDIKPGSMVLLLGGSGAGKTTLINAINGYEPAKAEIMLNGQNVYENYRQMKYNIGFVPQQDLMRLHDTVEHTLKDAAFLRLPSDLSRQAIESRVESVLELFGLTAVKNSMVRKLSGGQRKRLSIAMEFLSNPDLFILDEPDSGLDGVIARELMEQLRSIADQGKVVLIVTHTPDRCIDLFDHVIVLAKDSARTGRLAFYGTIQEAREFFQRDTMEAIVKCVNRPEEGGDGLADELVRKYAEVQHG